MSFLVQFRMYSNTFRLNFAVTQYTITTSSQPVAGGTTAGGGTFDGGSLRTVVATAAQGYRFVNWKENGTVVSTDASYPFTLNSHRTLVATFEALPCTHAWGAWSVATPATCATAGERSRLCNICGASEKETLAALGHDMPAAWTERAAAACEVAGEEFRKCTRCTFEETRAIAALAHAWGEWTVTKEPTVSADGEETRTCSLCGKEETRAIEKLPQVTGIVETRRTSLAQSTSATSLQAWTCHGLLRVTGLTVGETLRIYSASGALVHHSIATSGEADVPLRAQGVYIVHSGDNTVKVVF